MDKQEDPKIKKRARWRKWAGNAAFLAVMYVLLFTSLGKDVSVLVKRVFLMQPSIGQVQEMTRLNAADFSFRVRDLEGNLVPFSEFQGKVVFLNLWATWCPPCRAELPSIQKLYDRYGDKVAFLLVSGEQTEAVAAFMEKKDYSFPVYTVEDQMPISLQSSSIPATFILNKEGGLVLAKRGAVNWNGDNTTDLLDQLLGDGELTADAKQ